MSVHVVFFVPESIGADGAPGIGNIRAREVVSVPGVTETEVRQNEIVIVYNDGSTPILVAHGHDPDAEQLVSNADSSAGLPLSAGKETPPIVAQIGAAIAVAAL